MYGSAVVEHLVSHGGRAPGALGGASTAWPFCRTTAPGYPDWDIADQPRLLRSVHRRCSAVPVEALDSGMLSPKKSLLAVFGLTNQTNRARLSRGCSMRELLASRRASIARAYPADAAPRNIARSNTGNESAAPLGGASGLRSKTRGRLDRSALPLRRHHLQQHGPSAGVRIPRGARPAGRALSHSRAALRAGARRYRPRLTCANSPAEELLTRYRERKAAGRAVRWTKSFEWRRARSRPRAASAKQPAANTNGAWCSKRFTTLLARPAHEKDVSWKRFDERPAAGRWRHGHAAHARRSGTGLCGEAWNLTHPERVLAIQRRYAEAGSDCILTNTFGGSRIMLNRHSHARQRRGH